MRQSNCQWLYRYLSLVAVGNSKHHHSRCLWNTVSRPKRARMRFLLSSTISYSRMVTPPTQGNDINKRRPTQRLKQVVCTRRGSWIYELNTLSVALPTVLAMHLRRSLMQWLLLALALLNCFRTKEEIYFVHSVWSPRFLQSYTIDLSPPQFRTSAVI